jgi:hypothetical protein
MTALINRQKMKKPKYLILGIIILITTTGYYVYQKAMILATHTSPNDNYKAIIKRNRGFFIPTMPGDGGANSLPVVVILKDSSGKTIEKSSDNPECSIFDGSIEIA